MKVEPQREHRWLQRLVGEWTYETLMPKEGEPPARFTGTETVRALGEVWVLAEGDGQTPGGGVATTLLTLGFDPKKGQFVGTWIGSMMSNLWVYEGGELDPAEKALTMSAVGPSMSDENKNARYRDVITLESDDHRTLTAFIMGDDGNWQQMMRVDYRRRK